MPKGRDQHTDRTGAFLDQQRKRCATLGEGLMAFESALPRLEAEYTMVLGVSIRFPARVGFDWLIIVRAERPDGRVVAFTQGRTFFDALEGFVTAVEDNTLRWQPDKYAGQ